MKIIRRKRTITIETCVFRRWQRDGMEGNFNCPNCGKRFQEEAPIAADSKPARLLESVTVRNTLLGPSARERDGENQSCEQGCAEELGEQQGHET